MTKINEKTDSRKNPKVSVIIPVYNVERYLQQCLDSVIKQTLDDIEIICVNDASPDTSQYILDVVKKYDRRLVLLKHDSNRGLATARNTGMRVAKGEYIFFLDSDDYLATKDSLEILYEAAEADNADEIIGGILKWHEESDETYLDWHANYLKREIHGQPFKKLPELYANVIAVNKLLRRSFLINNRIYFNEKIKKHEDNPFSCRAHILADKITIIPKTTYIYRQTDKNNSIMSRENKDDADYRCTYCYDIFSFIEADKKRHIYRKRYYPMYSRQLVGSAKILSHFQPTNEEKKNLLAKWTEIIKVLSDDLPEIPHPQRDILSTLKTGDPLKAWEKALTHFNPNDKTLKKVESHQNQKEDILHKELARQKELNALLTSQIAIVYNSSSWRLTAPIRNLLLRIRGY